MGIETGTAILAAGALGVGGAAYASKKASSAAEKAAEAQSDALVRSTGLQLQYLRETRADIADAVDKGLIDLKTGFNMAIKELRPLAGMQEYNAARRLLQEPGAIMDRPATQFQFEQGVEALQGAFSRTSGGGVSGPALKAATEYGQNFASLALDAELARLMPFVDIATAARTNIANLYQGRGTSRANLRVGGATGTADVTGQVIPSVASNITAQGNVAASNLINQANITTGLTSGITGNISNLAMLYATNPSLFSGGGGGSFPEVSGVGTYSPR